MHKSKNIFLIFISIWLEFSALPIFAHQASFIKVPVIVDTDMALDDVRALCLLLNALGLATGMLVWNG